YPYLWLGCVSPCLPPPLSSFHHTPPTAIYTLSLHDALPIFDQTWARWTRPWTTTAWGFLTCGIALGSFWAYYELGWGGFWFWDRSEEHTSELQSRFDLVCRLLLEKKKSTTNFSSKHERCTR